MASKEHVLTLDEVSKLTLDELQELAVEELSISQLLAIDESIRSKLALTSVQLELLGPAVK